MLSKAKPNGKAKDIKADKEAERMKLSSLNRFKGQFVSVQFIGEEGRKEPTHIQGKVEDVEGDSITIEQEGGVLTRIFLNELIHIAPWNKKLEEELRKEILE